jgi:single-strand DNA-binding protein
MASVNKVILVGNLGANPELRYTTTGKAVCDFRLATSDSKDNTEWHRIVVWGKQAENCKEYLHKGRQVYVEGRLRTRPWEDKEGVKRFTTEVIGHSVQFLGSNGNGRKQASEQAEEAAEQPAEQAAE